MIEKNKGRGEGLEGIYQPKKNNKKESEDY